MMRLTSDSAGIRLALALSLLLAGAALGQAPVVQAQATCPELLTDGGFETSGVWLLGPTPLTSEYVTHTRHSGERSLALGITKGGNVAGYSSARQLVTIPANVSKAALSFWFYAMTTGNAAGDGMELVLLGADGQSVLDKPWSSQNDSRVWNQLTFDLTRWRGRTLYVYFNVYNNGTGGTAGMFLDDASFTACLTPTSTPVPTPVPTATSTATHTPAPTPTPGPPTPTTGPTTAPPTAGPCDLVVNGGFEVGWTGWQTAVGLSLPPRLAVSPEPVHTGGAALRLGTQETNAASYSSVRQRLTIPVGAPKVSVEFWAYTWSDGAGGGDRQEVIVFAENGTVLAKPWSELSNDRVWRAHAFDILGQAGRTVELYFNVYNDGAGGRTALFLDDVRAVTCGPTWPGTQTPEAPAERRGLGPGGTLGFTPPVTRIALTTPLPTPTDIATGFAPERPAPALTPTPTATPSAGPFRSAIRSLLEGRPREGIAAGLALVLVLLVLVVWYGASWIRGRGK
jgi:hypothetical protein